MRTFHTGGVAGDDITQGLPRVEELFEARKPKHPGLLTENAGTVHIGEENGIRKVTVTSEDGEQIYTIPYGSKLAVTEGMVIAVGDRLTEGSLNPHDILRISGVRATQRYLVQQVLGVYKSQGVEINDKHIEVMVRQMMRKIRSKKLAILICCRVNISMLQNLKHRMRKCWKKAYSLQKDVRCCLVLPKHLWLLILSCLLHPSRKLHAC